MSLELSQDMIEMLIGAKCNMLLKYVCSKIDKNNFDIAISKLQKSKTLAFLQDKKTWFYVKSDEELKYLLDKEYEGDVKAWELQAF